VQCGGTVKVCLASRVSPVQTALRNCTELTSLDHTCRDHRPNFSATLNGRSSLRWFGISDLIAESEGPSFNSKHVIP
jgi:hypothetical protein